MIHAETEYISSPYRISFICSFGYKVLHREKKKDRMLDEYTLQDERRRKYTVARKDFFSFVKTKHGNVERGKVETNSLIMYDLFYDLSKILS